MSEPDLLRAILVDPYDDVPRLIYADWLEENGNESRAKRIRRSIEQPDSTIRVDFSRKFRSNVFATMRRGFYESIHCYTDSLFNVLDEYFETDPITTVTLADKYPLFAVDPDHWWWWACGGYEWDREHGCYRYFDEHPRENGLPNGIYDRLKGSSLGYVRYPTWDEAMADLSQACVSLGRELAGLPPLKKVSYARG